MHNKDLFSGFIVGFIFSAAGTLYFKRLRIKAMAQNNDATNVPVNRSRKHSRHIINAFHKAQAVKISVDEQE